MTKQFCQCFKDPIGTAAGRLFEGCDQRIQGDWTDSEWSSICRLADERRARIRAKPFPIQGDKTNPEKGSCSWETAEKAWPRYCLQGGIGTVERMAERGGFTWGELDMFLPGWREIEAVARFDAALDERIRRDTPESPLPVDVTGLDPELR